MTNPANQLPPEYDDIHPRDYDPVYTADISSKMRIPDRLGLDTSHPEDRTLEAFNRENHAHDELRRSAAMNVPDKIVVFDDEPETTPGLHQDLVTEMFRGDPRQHVGLSTPPRVITVDERPFRYTDDEQFAENPVPNGGPTGGWSSGSLEEQVQMMTPGQPLLISDEGEHPLTLLRKQVDKLSVHVVRLEEENSKRRQRELILYPAIVGYLLIQVARWFLTSK